MLFPANTVSGVATVVSAKSAWPAVATTSVAAAELDPNAWLVALAVAISVMMVPLAVPAATCNTSCTLTLDPAATLAVVQVIVPVPPTGGVVQVVPGGAEIDWNVVLAGVVSVRVAFVAALLPVFVSTCV